MRLLAKLNFIQWTFQWIHTSFGQHIEDLDVAVVDENITIEWAKAIRCAPDEV